MLADMSNMSIKSINITLNTREKVVTIYRTFLDYFSKISEDAVKLARRSHKTILNVFRNFQKNKKISQDRRYILRVVVCVSAY